MSAEKKEHASIEILKEAILLERRGHAFYRKVAEEAADNSVREFFDTMAREELQHIEILETQFSAFVQSNEFESIDPRPIETPPQVHPVLNDAVKKRIAAADFEAAAISAAMLMEERAIALYSQRADAATDPAEEVLYRWLAEWEQNHLASLVSLDKEIKEAIWNDQQFWPF